MNSRYAIAIHQIATVTYSTNFYATPCVPLWTEEIIATQLLGYKFQSVAYTEVIHFQY